MLLAPRKVLPLGRKEGGGQEGVKLPSPLPGQDIVKWQKGQFGSKCWRYCGPKQGGICVSEVGTVALQVVGGLGLGGKGIDVLPTVPPTQVYTLCDRGGRRQNEARVPGGRRWPGACGALSPESGVQPAPSTQTVHR